MEHFMELSVSVACESVVGWGNAGPNRVFRCVAVARGPLV
jgi:hypothetical protein